ncbi:hypothetical protein ACFFX1_39565 [Dactylosporangium sucinum]|uniref:Alanine-rich protein n=1 Tax=Dactylosporangium sucinum TaxID=1424081 RepID=A0A917WGC7_9ACTN|nr:hypothetical protein [Dactylosporangium sucinum]GGM02946.1 hypothetical protein GCM10007977_000410 [Dactylosporangium sucinum]
MDTSAWIYPWDVADHGTSALSRVVRDAGLSAVNVAASYHSLFATVPDNPRRHLVELPRGMVYYRPDPAHWRDSAVEPRVSAWVDELGDALTLGRELAERAGCGLTAWTVCLHNSLGRRHPELALRTVWGDVVTAALCVRNPAVRAYAAALVADVGARADRVQLESAHWTPLPHHPHVKLALPHPVNLGMIAQICFCDHCRAAGEAAGVDVGALAGALRRRWQRCYETPVLEPLSTEEGYEAYQAVRVEAVTSLVAELVGRSPVPVEFVTFGDRAATGAHLAGIERAGAAVRALAYGPAERVKEVRAAEEAAPDRPRSLHLGLSLLPEHVADHEAFLGAVGAAGAAPSLSFYHLGLVGAERRTWPGHVRRG